MIQARGCRRCIWVGLACSAILHAAGAAILLHLDTPDRPMPGTDRTVPVELGMFGDTADADAPPPDATTPNPTKPGPEPQEPSLARTGPPAMPPVPKARPKPRQTHQPPEPNTEPHSPKRHEERTAETKPKHKAKPPPTPRPRPEHQPRRADNRISHPAPAAARRQTEERDPTATHRPRTSPGEERKGGGAPPGSPNRSQSQATEARYLSALQRAISRAQRYPSNARRNQQTGTATLAFVIQADGRIGQIRITKSSGTPSLDQAALDALRRLGRFKPIPAELGRGSWAIQVPIHFDLE